MPDAPTIAVRFFRLSEPIAPYFTALYLTDIDAGEGLVDDYLHPEWAAMRFTEGPPPIASVGPGEMAVQWPFVAGGPTSKAIHFGVKTSRVWGLGLQPAGWAKFACGVSGWRPAQLLAISWSSQTTDQGATACASCRSGSALYWAYRRR